MFITIAQRNICTWHQCSAMFQVVQRFCICLDRFDIQRLNHILKVKNNISIKYFSMQRTKYILEVKNTISIKYSTHEIHSKSKKSYFNSEIDSKGLTCIKIHLFRIYCVLFLKYVMNMCECRGS